MRELETMIQESICKVLGLNFQENELQDPTICTSREEIIKGIKLRNSIHTNIGYSEETSKLRENDIQFDNHEGNSIHIILENEIETIASIRVVLPKEGRYNPCIENVSDRTSDYLKGIKKLGEISRFVVNPKYRGINIPFKIFRGVYRTVSKIPDSKYILSTKTSHRHWYQKLGGIELLEEREDYGKIKVDASIMIWDPAERSEFSKRKIKI